jgi:transposase-like protein
MNQNPISFDKNHLTSFENALEEIARAGARKMLQQALDIEVEEFLERFKDVRTEQNRKAIVRNGFLPERAIQTGLGPIAIQQPRVRDKRCQEKFSSSILPPYMRRSRSVESLIPLLYLKGISTSDFSEVLESLLGENAKGLSPTNIVRLKQVWEEDYKEWENRDLRGKRYVYIWADGIYFNVRLQEDRPCVLVIIGALSDGSKELVAIHDGHRESKDSWKEVMGNLRRKGLSLPPMLAIGDGALGFWAALEEIFPSTKQQRCWVHKTVNILDKMAKSAQSNAKRLIHEMYMAETKEKGMAAFDGFIRVYEAKYPKACECLRKDKDQLFTFYDFPAEHWVHIRTTNPIESTFATVRHRTRQTKGCGSRLATMTMVFKLTSSAQKRWRKIRGYKLIEKIINGIKFVNGEEVKIQENVA